MRRTISRVRAATIICLITGAPLIMCCTSLAGPPLFWDTNGPAAGAAPAVPGAVAPGPWDLVTPFWTGSAIGVVPTGAWVAGDSAIFSAGADAGGAFAVTIAPFLMVPGGGRDEL
jgi:hypothetical protein